MARALVQEGFLAVSYRRYLDEQRPTLIDHRMSGLRGPGVPIDPDDTPEVAPVARGSGSRRFGRARGGGSAGPQVRRRYNHVRPAFAPLPWSDPLPYEDPMERAFRWNS